MDAAAAIRAVASEQARFDRNKRDSVISVNGAAADAAAVGGKTARHVEGEHRGVQRIHSEHQIGETTADVALQANAEQAVDHQIPRNVVRNVVQQGAATVDPVLAGSSCIGGQFLLFAGKHQIDHVMPLPEMARDHKGIAAIIAGAGDYQDAAIG